MSKQNSNIIYLFHRPEPVVWGEIQSLYKEYYAKGSLSFVEFRHKFNNLAKEVHTIRHHRKRHRRVRN